jgi:hypothetical protein
VKNSYKILSLKTLEKKRISRPKRRLEDNIRMDVADRRLSGRIF